MATTGKRNPLRANPKKLKQFGKLRTERQKKDQMALINIVTRVPEKWKLVDLETGEEWAGEKLANWFASGFAHAMQGVTMCSSFGGNVKLSREHCVALTETLRPGRLDR